MKKLASLRKENNAKLWNEAELDYLQCNFNAIIIKFEFLNSR